MSRFKSGNPDSNQAGMVKDLRDQGFSVAITSGVGDGFGDLVVAYGGLNLLVEVKDPEKSPSARKLTEAEQKFHDEWKGPIIVAETSDEVARWFRLKEVYP